MSRLNREFSENAMTEEAFLLLLFLFFLDLEYKQQLRSCRFEFLFVCLFLMREEYMGKYVTFSFQCLSKEEVCLEKYFYFSNLE